MNGSDWNCVRPHHRKTVKSILLSVDNSIKQKLAKMNSTLNNLPTTDKCCSCMQSVCGAQQSHSRWVTDENSNVVYNLQIEQQQQQQLTISQPILDIKHTMPEMHVTLNGRYFLDETVWNWSHIKVTAITVQCYIEVIRREVFQYIIHIF